MNTPPPNKRHKKERLALLAAGLFLLFIFTSPGVDKLTGFAGGARDDATGCGGDVRDLESKPSNTTDSQAAGKGGAPDFTESLSASAGTQATSECSVLLDEKAMMSQGNWQLVFLTTSDEEISADEYATFTIVPAAELPAGVNATHPWFRVELHTLPPDTVQRLLLTRTITDCSTNAFKQKIRRLHVDFTLYPDLDDNVSYDGAFIKSAYLFGNVDAPDTQNSWKTAFHQDLRAYPEFPDLSPGYSHSKTLFLDSFLEQSVSDAPPQLKKTGLSFEFKKDEEKLFSFPFTILIRSIEFGDASLASIMEKKAGDFFFRFGSEATLTWGHDAKTWQYENTNADVDFSQSKAIEEDETQELFEAIIDYEAKAAYLGFKVCCFTEKDLFNLEDIKAFNNGPLSPTLVQEFIAAQNYSPDIQLASALLDETYGFSNMDASTEVSADLAQSGWLNTMVLETTPSLDPFHRHLLIGEEATPYQAQFKVEPNTSYMALLLSGTNGNFIKGGHNAGKYLWDPNTRHISQIDCPQADCYNGSIPVPQIEGPTQHPLLYKEPWNFKDYQELFAHFWSHRFTLHPFVVHADAQGMIRLEFAPDGRMFPINALALRQIDNNADSNQVSNALALRMHKKLHTYHEAYLDAEIKPVWPLAWKAIGDQTFPQDELSLYRRRLGNNLNPQIDPPAKWLEDIEDGIELTVAQGESGHLILGMRSSYKQSKDFDILTSSLQTTSGLAIPTQNIRIQSFRIDTRYINRSSYLKRRYRFEQSTLHPLATWNKKLRPGFNREVLMTIDTQDLAPGHYKGRIVLDISNLNRISIPLEVEIQPFTLDWKDLSPSFYKPYLSGPAALRWWVKSKDPDYSWTWTDYWEQEEYQEAYNQVAEQMRQQHFSQSGTFDYKFNIEEKINNACKPTHMAVPNTSWCFKRHDITTLQIAAMLGPEAASIHPGEPNADWSSQQTLHPQRSIALNAHSVLAKKYAKEDTYLFGYASQWGEYLHYTLDQSIIDQQKESFKVIIKDLLNVLQGTDLQLIIDIAGEHANYPDIYTGSGAALGVSQDVPEGQYRAVQVLTMLKAAIGELMTEVSTEELELFAPNLPVRIAMAGNGLLDLYGAFAIKEPPPEAINTADNNEFSTANIQPLLGPNAQTMVDILIVNIGLLGAMSIPGMEHLSIPEWLYQQGIEVWFYNFSGVDNVHATSRFGYGLYQFAYRWKTQKKPNQTYALFDSTLPLQRMMREAYHSPGNNENFNHMDSDSMPWAMVEMAYKEESNLDESTDSEPFTIAPRLSYTEAVSGAQDFAYALNAWDLATQALSHSSRKTQALGNKVLRYLKSLAWKIDLRVNFDGDPKNVGVIPMPVGWSGQTLDEIQAKLIDFIAQLHAELD